MAYHKRMKMMTKTLPYAEPMLDFWKRRKIEDFGQYKYLMGEYKLIPLEGYTFSLRIEARSIGQTSGAVSPLTEEEQFATL